MAAGGLSKFVSNILRKKDLTTDMMRKDLTKCLGFSDITFLSIGSMVGAGLYVLTGTVALKFAGGSIVLSYLFAAIASALSAFCYAEFAARIPVTGSAYQFTYISVGEFWAFVIGWNVALEHAVSVSAVAKSWSGYFDSLLGHKMRDYLLIHAPMPGGIVAKYPDFFAAGIVLIVTIIVATGVKFTSRLTSTFAALNLVIVVFIFCTGLYLSKWANWTTVRGGFFPHGFSGTISGAATLIFSYTGYEVVASVTEETINPNRDVPLALLISISVAAVAYISASASLTLMVPWYDISITAPFPTAYAQRGWVWAKYVVSLGALAAMSTTVIAAMIVVPRYFYAMSNDGLIMPWFKRVNEKTGTPVISTVVTGIFCMIMTLVFSLHSLVEFISIGQLLACTFVAFCVIKLRYEPNQIAKLAAEMAAHSDATELSARENETTLKSKKNGKDNDAKTKLLLRDSYTAETVLDKSMDAESASESQEELLLEDYEHHCGVIKDSIMTSPFGKYFAWTLNFKPGVLPFYSLMLATFFGAISAAMFLFGFKKLKEAWFVCLVVIFILLSKFFLLFICMFKQDETIKTYKVPFVPFVPFTSIIINIILMFKLQHLTWIRLAIWMSIGLVIYFGYGYRHSKSRKQTD
uniref:cationic amino acid transporter 2-like n=1 Tax=Ciona intestinalis TaxID=7719 RepID=UPI0002B8E13A|nr:cationic amino acid transporter 2-like [Ciona intestinalis]|eukprot:XP_002123144.2 cationic amino acid transporter 2-like [Ciona intestinalis]